MRAFTGLAPSCLGLLFALGCGKQLNPDFCLHHATDLDCLDAGLVFIDAPPACTSNAVCTEPGKAICDTALGTCVECTAAQHGACLGGTTVCSADDVCVGCDQNSQCSSNVCLHATGTGTCAAPGDVLFVAVAPTGTGSCLTDTNQCTLTTALGKARLPGSGHVISMAGGDYHEGPLTLDIPNLTIVAPIGQAVTITNPGGAPILNVTTGPVLVLNVAIYNAQGADAVVCNNATLTLDTINVHDNPQNGIKARNCTLTIDRSTFQRNQDHAMDIDSTQLSVHNCFILENGNNTTNDGAVKLGSATLGEFRFNTVAFNNGKDNNGHGQQSVTGVNCDINTFPFKVFNATDNLLAENPGDQYSRTILCDMSRTWVGNADTVKFVRKDPPYDLHLTAQTPSSPPNAIRDLGNSNCGNVKYDIDSDVRPYNLVCDLGADEFRP